MSFAGNEGNFSFCRVNKLHDVEYMYIYIYMHIYIYICCSAPFGSWILIPVYFCTSIIDFVEYAVFTC